MISIEGFRNNPELFVDLINKLKERVFLKTEIDIVYSDLVNWERSNLINIEGDSNKGDWKKLNYFEYTWVKIIQELRSFGFSYDEIENYKSELMIVPRISEVIKAGKLDIENIEDKLGSDVVKEFNSLSNSDCTNNLEIGISVFELMITNVIGTGEKWSLLFFKDIPGFFLPISVETFRAFELKGIPEFPEELLSKTFLSVSLSGIISNFLIDGDNSFIKRTISILTREEHALLKQIRKGYGKIKSIKIRFIDNRMEMLEVTSIKKAKLESRLLEFIKKGDYQSISIDTVDGNIVNFENTQKIKL